MARVVLEHNEQARGPAEALALVSTRARSSGRRAIGKDEKGKPKRFRALAQYRDFDKVTRVVQVSGKTATQASQNLRQALQNRTQAGRHGDLTAMSRFSE